MSGKSSFTRQEWAVVKDAPQWVYAALAAADGRTSIIKGKKEARAFEEKVTSYKTRNRLVRDVLADDKGVAANFRRKKLHACEEALTKIGNILDAKVDDAEADGLRTFLLDAGKAVAEATGEGILSKEKISDHEEEALNMIAIALKATAGDKRRRQAETNRELRAVAAKKRQAEAATKRKEAAKRKRLATLRKKSYDAKVKKSTEVRAKRAEERAAAKVEAQLKRQAAEKARLEAKRKTIMAKAKARRAAVAKNRAKAEAARKAAAAAAAKAAEEAKRYYTVVSGDSLSAISLKMYGSAARWGEIFEANRNILDKPNLIYPGQKLLIP